MQNNNQTELYKVLLEDGKKLSITGVDSVDGFSEQFLNLTIASKKVKIVGENIKITSYNKVTGAFNAEGAFNEIKFNTKKEPFVKRIFK